MAAQTSNSRQIADRAIRTAASARRFGFSGDEAEPSDTEKQIAPLQNATEWEGFGQEGEEHGESSSEELEEEQSGSESVHAQTEKKQLTSQEKDAEEEELQRMVFGDSAGFRAGLKAFSLDPVFAGFDKEDEDIQQDDEDPKIEALADQDLFFFDSGPIGLPKASAATHTEDEDEAEDEDADKPAWEDSDDERLIISLASVPRLRKLRETEQEDVVNGAEYARRLRRQYHRLYSTPEWAVKATGKTKRKRTATRDDESGDEPASDMDVDDNNELSAQPLARLLKDADILARTSRGTAKRRKLQSGVVDIQKLRNVSNSGPSAITSLSFHPTYPLLLSSGPSSTLYLHHINQNAQNPNPLLTSLHIKRTPLATTAFHPSQTDSRIFLSARRRYFHIWDLTTGSIEKVSRIYGHQHEQRTMEHFSLSPDGKYMALRGSSKKGGGVINVLDAKTLQWTTQARIQSRGGIADFAWWGDGGGLTIAGKNGEITEWSIDHGVIGRWIDDGAVGTTVIALGGKSGRDDWIGGDRWVATGSSSGIVNVYDRRVWSENEAALHGDEEHTKELNGGIPKAPKPLRTLENLTTPTSHLTFSPDGQILCMASRWKHNALRLVHLPSATVFKNWPTQRTTLDRVSAVAWGRPTEADEKEGALALLAVGSEMGRVRLWEVRA